MAKNKKNGKDMLRDLEEQGRKLDNLIRKDLPLKIIQEAERNVDESFQKEQYQDGKSSKWAPVKSNKESGKARSDRKGVLIGSGDLVASVEADQEGINIVIGSDKVYAQIHNEGLQGTAFGKHSFKMPERQFMPKPGEEPPFQDEVNKFIDDQMDEIFN